MGSLERRLEALEGRVEAPEQDRSEVRARMKAHLDRIAAFRRGELGAGEAAEVEAMTSAIDRRRAEIREGSDCG